MKPSSFVIRLDKNGNSTRLYSNGIISVRVKVNKLDSTYVILDIKNGMILVNKHCVSHKSMLKHIRRDILQLFEIYKSSNDYDAIFSRKLSLKNRI